jgi:hypothetical protein
MLNTLSRAVPRREGRTERQGRSRDPPNPLAVKGRGPLKRILMKLMSEITKATKVAIPKIDQPLRRLNNKCVSVCQRL